VSCSVHYSKQAHVLYSCYYTLTGPHLISNKGIDTIS